MRCHLARRVELIFADSEEPYLFSFVKVEGVQNARFPIVINVVFGSDTVFHGSFVTMFQQGPSAFIRA